MVAEYNADVMRAHDANAAYEANYDRIVRAMKG